MNQFWRMAEELSFSPCKKRNVSTQKAKAEEKHRAKARESGRTREEKKRGVIACGFRTEREEDFEGSGGVRTPNSDERDRAIATTRTRRRRAPW